MNTKIIAVVCALCAPGAASAASDNCSLDVNEKSGLRNILVNHQASANHRAGDVTFSFNNRRPVRVNVDDPEPRPVQNMTGADMKELMFRANLLKRARIHHLACLRGALK